MRVSVEATGELGRKLTVAIPADELEQAIHDRLKRMAKTVRLPGFRPGRAPLKVIDAKYGPQVFQEVAGQLIESSLRDALSQEGLTPAAGPDIEPKSLGRGSDLEYVASFDVMPDINKLNLEGVRIERPLCEVTDADVDKTIESMRKQRVEWRPVERAARDGDRVRLDFRGSIDGEPFPGGEAQDYPVVLGENTLLKDFAQALDGAQGNQEKTIRVRFPDDYHGRDVAGKEAEFHIKVLEVAEPVLPQVDGEFAKSFGIEDGSVDKMRQDVKENLMREVAERVNRVVRGRVMVALMEANQIELPRKLVAAEVHRMRHADQAVHKQQGVAVDEPDPAQFEPEARRRVALGLIMHEVVKAHKLVPDKDRVRARVASMAASYQDPQAFVQWYYSDPKRLEQVESLVLEEQVVRTLLDSAAVADKPTSVDELMYGDVSTNI